MVARGSVNRVQGLPRSGGGRLVEAIRGSAAAFHNAEEAWQELRGLVSGAEVVLLGEATHGTHEFYALRGEITQRLIAEAGFTIVAVEADWPDAYRVNRHVRSAGEGTGGARDGSAIDALGDFKRFPLWMWRNREVVRLIEWMRERNARVDERGRAGFYGLDLYSLHSSMDAVIRYLEGVDAAAARRARRRYACLHSSGADKEQEYGVLVGLGLRRSCEDEVIEQLIELRRSATEYVRRDGMLAIDEQFFAERNARLVQAAETYYRQMFAGEVNTWNLRDAHMHETLTALRAHASRTGGGAAKAVVWAHNSHIGDASATEARRRGEFNLGQLSREAWGAKAALVGFTTHAGTVTAASAWGRPGRRMSVRPSQPGSVERLLHETGMERFALVLRDREVAGLLRDERPERMIGVVYRRDDELRSHYVPCAVSLQFDAVVHVDRTTALEPLDRVAGWSEDDVPETFPTGL